MFKDLDLTFGEEIDLLVKWLGKESAEYVTWIWTVKVNNPERGLRMIWIRPEECYGSSKVMENELFKHLESFPKLSNKDYAKLIELSDWLMELQSARVDKDLPGLAVLENVCGVNPRVEKLPFRLQERWVSIDSDYKLAQCPISSRWLVCWVF